MRNKLLLAALLTALLLCPTLVGAQERFPSVKELMTEQELEASA